MKTKLFLLFAIMIYGNINAQQSSQHIISTALSQAGSIYAADFNGDNHMDVISAATLGNDIDWWENDGNEIFTRHNISIDVDRVYQVYAANIDENEDDDMDVFYVSRDNDKLAWHENTDGLGNFGPQQLITAQANTDGPRFLDFADLDGDGLKDVLSASHVDGKIAWYKNLGDGDFGDINTNQRVISNVEVGATSVHATDIDGDDDFDVVAASSSFQGGIREIVWFENLGNGNFGTRRLVEDAFADPVSVSSGDFNDDGHMDLVSVSFDDNKIAWHENDGNGTFVTHILSEEAAMPAFVYVTDFSPTDEYPDFLVAIAGDNEIVAYVNDGVGNFKDHVITIPGDVNFPVSVHTADVNGDGTIDALSASVLDSKIAWYSPIPILSVNDYTLLDFSVYPSPTKGILNIHSKTAISRIEVYNQLGQLVMSNSNKNIIDISSVSQGIYFVKVIDENGNIGSKKIVKN